MEKPITYEKQLAIRYVNALSNIDSVLPDIFHDVIQGYTHHKKMHYRTVEALTRRWAENGSPNFAGTTFDLDYARDLQNAIICKLKIYSSSHFSEYELTKCTKAFVYNVLESVPVEKRRELYSYSGRGSHKHRCTELENTARVLGNYTVDRFNLRTTRIVPPLSDSL